MVQYSCLFRRESGKIGVTITTSPKSSPVLPNQELSPRSSGSTPPAKIARTHSGQNIHSYRTSGDAHDQSSPATPSKSGKQSREERQVSPKRFHHSSSTKKDKESEGSSRHDHAAGEKDDQDKTTASSTSLTRSPDKSVSSKHAYSSTNGSVTTNGHGVAASGASSHEKSGVPAEGDSNNNAPPAEYWINKQPLADQIVITDVTVNLMTVTIRECKTKLGFFKSSKEGESPSKAVTENSSNPQINGGGTTASHWS